MDMNDEQSDTLQQEEALELSINELILHGTELAAAPLARAFRERLTQLLSTEKRTFERSQQLQIRPLQVRFEPGASAAEVGQRLAHTIHGALRR